MELFKYKIQKLIPPPRDSLFLFFVFKKILFIFRERGRKGERERNINVWLPLMRPVLGT